VVYHVTCHVIYHMIYITASSQCLTFYNFFVLFCSLQMTLTWTLKALPPYIVYTISIFLIFYSYFCTVILSIFGNAPLTLKQDTQYLSSTIPYFGCFFFVFWHSHTFHIWKHHPLFLSYFIGIFYFCIATISIFRNATGTLQQYPQHCHQPSSVFS
jgi:hypothetical protein